MSDTINATQRTREELKQILIDSIHEMTGEPINLDEDKFILAQYGYNHDLCDEDKLKEILESKGLEIINIDRCDTITDILLNNFGV